MDNRLLYTILKNVKQYSDNDVFLAVKLAYAACGDDTPISEYNNILLIELENIRNIPEIKNNFENCINKWHNLESKEKEKWRKKALGRNYTGFSRFVSECQSKKENVKCKE